eukprot:403360320
MHQDQIQYYGYKTQQKNFSKHKYSKSFCQNNYSKLHLDNGSHFQYQSQYQSKYQSPQNSGPKQPFNFNIKDYYSHKGQFSYQKSFQQGNGRKSLFNKIYEQEFEFKVKRQYEKQSIEQQLYMEKIRLKELIKLQLEQKRREQDQALIERLSSKLITNGSLLNSIYLKINVDDPQQIYSFLMDVSCFGLKTNAIENKMQTLVPTLSLVLDQRWTVEDDWHIVYYQGDEIQERDSLEESYWKVQENIQYDRLSVNRYFIISWSTMEWIPQVKLITIYKLRSDNCFMLEGIYKAGFEYRNNPVAQRKWKRSFMKRFYQTLITSNYQQKVHK